MELGVQLISLLPSSKTFFLVMRPGGSDPGPEGEVRCLTLPIPGLGARLGGVPRPKPLSVSAFRIFKFIRVIFRTF